MKVVGFIGSIVFSITGDVGLKRGSGVAFPSGAPPMNGFDLRGSLFFSKFISIGIEESHDPNPSLLSRSSRFTAGL